MHASLRPHVELRPHQKEGVERMMFMEKMYRGGILADDVKKKKECTGKYLLILILTNLDGTRKDVTDINTYPQTAAETECPCSYLDRHTFHSSWRAMGR